MASNGVILLNLNNRNAADFQSLEVPDSYEKASGALTAGTYVTVYKWLYEGFMLAPSLCDAVDATDHINLVDRTNGGILEVYPNDTITITATPEPEPPEPPEPEPEPSNPEDPYYRNAVKVYRKTGVAGKLYIENGTTVGDGQSKTFVGDGIEVEIDASSLVGYHPGVYVVPGICIIQHGGTAPDGDWYFTSTAGMNIYSPTLSDPWSYVGSGYSVTQGWSDDGVETTFYYVFEHRNTNGSDFPEFNMGGVDFVGQSFGPSNIMSLISSAVEESFIVMATNFSVEGNLKGATPTSVSKFTDSDNQTFYTMENEFFKYSASENPFGQAYIDFHIKEE